MKQKKVSPGRRKNIKVEYYENDKGFGLYFKDGIDPRILINAIKKIDP